MLTNVISSFVPKKSTVLKLISWKHSFKRLNEEYEIAKKKKQALDNLLETGRISQSTHDSFNDEITAAITEIEKQQQDLLAKMQLKIQDLESQIKTLETLLANYEIQHVVGEIDEEIYQREVNLLAAGLETAKHELDIIKEAANQLCTPVPAPVTEPSPPLESEAAQDQPAENVSVTPAEVEVTTEPYSQEPTVIIEEAAPEPEQPAVENEEALPAETSPEENTEVVPVETSQTAEETPTEPLTTVEEAVEEASPEIEQPPAENAEVISVEVPQSMEEITEETPQAVEGTPKEAHPQEAPQEAQQEIIVEAITEQTECAEETPPAEETAAESAEDQGEA
jgi:hypothetical protein